MTLTNTNKVMRRLRVNRQVAQQVFPNLMFSHLRRMCQENNRPEEPPGRAYSPDHEYDNDYSFDMEANDRGD